MILMRKPSTPPPPGAERIQWDLLERWGVGRAVPDLAALAAAVGQLLNDTDALTALRDAAGRHRKTNAAREIGRWLHERSVTPAEVTGMAPRPARTAAWSGANA